MGENHIYCYFLFKARLKHLVNDDWHVYQIKFNFINCGFHEYDIPTEMAITKMI